MVLRMQIQGFLPPLLYSYSIVVIISHPDDPLCFLIPSYRLATVDVLELIASIESFHASEGTRLSLLDGKGKTANRGYKPPVLQLSIL